MNHRTKISAAFSTLVLALLLLATRVAVAEQPTGARRANAPARTAAGAAQRGVAPGGAPAAAPTETPINAAAVLARTYEEKAKEALEAYVPQREFLVSAQVVPNGKAIPRAPYEPRALTPGVTLNLTPEELDGFVTRVSIDVALSSRLQPARRRIEDLLTKTLGIKRQRGDRLTFSPLGIEIEDDAWKKEKLDLKRELEVLKSENNRLNQELASRKGDSDSGDPNSLKNQDWFLPALVGGAAFLLLMGLLAIGRGFFSAGRRMGEAISNVASSLERIGGALQTGGPGGGGTGGGVQSLEAKLLAEGGKGGLSSLPMDVIHAHLLKLRAEILDAMTEGTASVILRHLTQLLSKPDTVARAVVTLELLGRETATELFRRLGIRAQETIMIFFRQGLYAGSKIELMLEAAEDLKTKLLVESLERVKGKASEKVAQRLIQISDEELAQVALEMDTESLPRLFLYLDPQKIAAVISSMRRLNPDKYNEALTVLSKLPEASTNDSYDDNIVVALDTVIDRTKNDAQRPFLKVYQDIVESADEEVSEQIVRELSQDPRVDEYFRQNVISINTFFLLPEEQRNEILEALSNKDIAALALGVKPEEQQVLLDAVPARRKSLVAEEFESLQARGSRNIQMAFKKVREQIVTRLKQMKADGTLVVAGVGAVASEAPPARAASEPSEEAVVAEAPESEESAEESPQEDGEAPVDDETATQFPDDSGDGQEAA